jgi:hypothetical protein
VCGDRYDEANRHRWIQSEKAGYDLAEAAIRDWVRRHWSGYLRARLLEHLRGTRFCMELDRAEFGILPDQFPDHPKLVGEIVERLAAGADNLTILTWAVETGQPMETVAAILQVIDINCPRFSPPDDADPPHIVEG